MSLAELHPVAMILLALLALAETASLTHHTEAPNAQA